jgi:hypothetical protein
MAPPNAERPAPAAAGNGPREDHHAGRRDGFSDSKTDPKKQALLDDLAAARRHLENRTHNLEVIRAWRDELRVRLARSQLRMELIGLSDEEQQRLVEEIENYKRCCCALNWSTSGRRPA